MSGIKNILNRMMCLSLLASVGFAALLSLTQTDAALAQTAPPLGLVQQFGAFGGSGVTGAAGAGVIVNGDVGSSPTATISNFPPSTVSPPFVLHLTNDLTVQQAHTDAIAAYNFLAAQGPGTVLPAQLDGAVITTGIYSFAGGAADLAALGTLTLNGPGVFVFQVDSALTANVGSNVIGTANPCNVYWRVGTSATLNGVSFRGNVIADASITVGSGSNVTGRVIAGTGPTGAVTMAGAGGNTIGGCSASVLVPTTLSTQASPGVVLGAAVSDTATLSGGANPTGTITFKLYGPNDATCSNTAIFTSTVTVSGNGSYGSTPAFTPTAAGTYRWIANYSGDANNNATSNACNGANENVTVTVPVTVTPAPTLNEWGVIILMVLVGLMSIYYLRRQKAKA